MHVLTDFILPIFTTILQCSNVSEDQRDIVHILRLCSISSIQLNLHCINEMHIMYQYESPSVLYFVAEF